MCNVVKCGVATVWPIARKTQSDWCDNLGPGRYVMIAKARHSPSHKQNAKSQDFSMLLQYTHLCTYHLRSVQTLIYNTWNTIRDGGAPEPPSTGFKARTRIAKPFMCINWTCRRVGRISYAPHGLMTTTSRPLTGHLGRKRVDQAAS